MSDQYPYARTSGLATASLIFGLLGWTFLPTLGAVIAVILGHMAKSEINNSRGYLTGGGLATAGLVLGYINIALSLIGICLAILVITSAITLPVCLIPFMDPSSFQ